jgi:hypothetical protein
VNDRVELLFDLAPRQAEEACAEVHVFAAGQFRMEAGAELDERDGVAANAYRPARGPGHARDELEERGLARAVSADDPEARSGRDLERHVPQRPDRRRDSSTRGRVDVVISQTSNAGRDQIDERPRSARAVRLGDVVQLDGEHSVRSAGL